VPVLRRLRISLSRSTTSSAPSARARRARAAVLSDALRLVSIYALSAHLFSAGAAQNPKISPQRSSRPEQLFVFESPELFPRAWRQPGFPLRNLLSCERVPVLLPRVSLRLCPSTPPFDTLKAASPEPSGSTGEAPVSPSAASPPLSIAERLAEWRLSVRHIFSVSPRLWPLAPLLYPPGYFLRKQELRKYFLFVVTCGALCIIFLNRLSITFVSGRSCFLLEGKGGPKVTTSLPSRLVFTNGCSRGGCKVKT